MELHNAWLGANRGVGRGLEAAAGQGYSAHVAAPMGARSVPLLQRRLALPPLSSELGEWRGWRERRQVAGEFLPIEKCFVISHK